MRQGSWPLLLTGISQGPLETTCSDPADLGSDFGLGLTWVRGWLKPPPAADANMRLVARVQVRPARPVGLCLFVLVLTGRCQGLGPRRWGVEGFHNQICFGGRNKTRGQVTWRRSQRSSVNTWPGG